MHHILVLLFLNASHSLMRYIFVPWFIKIISICTICSSLLNHYITNQPCVYSQSPHNRQTLWFAIEDFFFFCKLKSWIEEKNKAYFDQALSWLGFSSSLTNLPFLFINIYFNSIESDVIYITNLKGGANWCNFNKSKEKNRAYQKMRCIWEK